MRDDSRRIFLKDYTADECAALDAGPLMDWLVAQAIGNTPGPPNNNHDKGWVIMLGITLETSIVWWDDEISPRCYHGIQGWFKFSTDGNAALRVLEWLKQSRRPWHLIPSALGVEGWSLGFEDVPDVEYHSSPTPHVAICRAALALAKAKENNDGK